MAETSHKTVLLHVRRGAAGEVGHYGGFGVPYEEGLSVLDALRWIRTYRDSSLAIRYSCINANACKTCLALVNGLVEYTCTARLNESCATVEPLPSRRVIRDLVTDTAPADETDH